MAQQFKTGTDQSNFLQKDLAERIGRNPAYSKMAQYARGDDQDITDDYFYAFKDAYEKSPTFNKYNNHYIPFADIENELSEAYYRMQDDDYDSHGLTPGSYESDREYERMYGPEFERKHGTHDDYVRKGMDAWERWMKENYGGSSEDHQSFGRYIRENPNEFKDINALQKYYSEWSPFDSYPELLEFWKNKLGFNRN